MRIHLLAKDQLESQGIKWMIESHFTGIRLTISDSLEDCLGVVRDSSIDLLLVDVDVWDGGSGEMEELLATNKVNWLGISSKRIFQTAYLGLQYRAIDILFRPFSPEELMKHIQQIRYKIRNQHVASKQNHLQQMDALNVTYSSILLQNEPYHVPVTMVAFLTEDLAYLPQVYNRLSAVPFTGRCSLFVFSQYVLCVHETKDVEVFQEEFHTFLSEWKEEVNVPLAILSQVSHVKSSLKEVYEQTKVLTEEIFFEGYDIIHVNDEPIEWMEMDPFLTPVEQREWIEMLEKRDVKGIQDWVEHEFLTYERPYPNPEMVRVRLSSLLAQIRRYMKSHSIHSEEWETAYYAIFQDILQCQIVYELIRRLLRFTMNLISDEVVRVHMEDGEQSLVEKTMTLIESNYWDAQWGLPDCADALRLNKSTLSRRFSMESGQSFRNVLHQFRMTEAKRLLQETDLSMEEISRLVGYVHQSYFTEKFKEIAKCTPSAYRTGIKK